MRKEIKDLITTFFEQIEHVTITRDEVELRLEKFRHLDYSSLYPNLKQQYIEILNLMKTITQGTDVSPLDFTSRYQENELLINLMDKIDYLTKIVNNYTLINENNLKVVEYNQVIDNTDAEITIDTPTETPIEVKSNNNIKKETPIKKGPGRPKQN